MPTDILFQIANRIHDSSPDLSSDRAHHHSGLPALAAHEKRPRQNHRPLHLIEFPAAVLPTATTARSWSTAGLRNRTAGLAAVVMSETLKQAAEQTTTTLMARRTARVGSTVWLRNGAANWHWPTVNRCWCTTDRYWLTAGLRAAGLASKATEQSSFNTLRSQNIAQKSHSQN